MSRKEGRSFQEAQGREETVDAHSLGFGDGKQSGRSTPFDKLFKSANPYEVEGDWIDDVNPNSMVVCPRARVPRYVAEQAKNNTSLSVTNLNAAGILL